MYKLCIKTKILFPLFIETKDTEAVPNIPTPTVCKEAPVKSSNLPYIQEEEEILKNINLVSNIKQKFGSK